MILFCFCFSFEKVLIIMILIFKDFEILTYGEMLQSLLRRTWDWDIGNLVSGV